MRKTHDMFSQRVTSWSSFLFYVLRCTDTYFSNTLKESVWIGMNDQFSKEPVNRTKFVHIKKFENMEIDEQNENDKILALCWFSFSVPTSSHVRCNYLIATLMNYLLTEKKRTKSEIVYENLKTFHSWIKSTTLDWILCWSRAFAFRKERELKEATEKRDSIS